MRPITAAVCDDTAGEDVDLVEPRCLAEQRFSLDGELRTLPTCVGEIPVCGVAEPELPDIIGPGIASSVGT
jgi:hypothetical protein